jgi:hypothetical protein
MIPTSTILYCSPNPVKLGKAASCSAIVISPNGAPPLGTVEFVSSITGDFTKVSCTVSSSQLDCTTKYTPHKVGKALVIAQYFAPGGSSFNNSQDRTTLKIETAQQPRIAVNEPANATLSALSGTNRPGVAFPVAVASFGIVGLVGFIFFFQKWQKEATLIRRIEPRERITLFQPIVNQGHSGHGRWLFYL